MKAKYNQNQTRSWIAGAALALLLCAGTVWITFDSLFAPLSPRGERVEIPNYCGLQEESLSFADWMQVTTEYRYDAKAPAGTVVAQTPSAGSLRKLSAKHPTCALSLVVSLGEELASLPNVIGIDEREATARLRALGFSVYVQRISGQYPTGQVLDMSPSPGTKLPLGKDVTLTVSGGLPAVTVTVPDLRGLSRADALMRIWSAQLAVDSVVEIPSQVTAGTVLRQSHVAGTTVSAGTKMTIYVSSGMEDESF